MNEVEQLVIKNLLLDEEYVRKAMPFIKTEYFAETEASFVIYFHPAVKLGRFAFFSGRKNFF